MKKIILLLLSIPTICLSQLIEKPTQLKDIKPAFDSTIKAPLMIAGGGILLSPIQYIEMRKSTINYTIPVIATGVGMLMMSSSMHRAQSDWYNKQTSKNFTTSADDYLAFVPNVAAIGLGVVGVKAKHSFKERMLVAAMANGIMFAAVTGLKYTTGVQRPDKSANNSFPSGHTAMAFTGAEMMHEEYGNQSVIYSIMGYTIGGVTGSLRVLNNRHWVSDVIAGAGIGMLSTKLAYRLLPWAQKKVFKNEKLALLPIYLPSGAGIDMVFNIK